MDIGVPKERRPFEFRVGLTPSSVRVLVSEGHRVYVENDAGKNAGFNNEEYERVGAIILYDEEEIYARPDLLVKFSRPMYSEIQKMKDRQILLGFLQLHASKRDKLDLLVEKKITAIGCEFLYDGNTYPVLSSMSMLSGQLTVSIASQLLNNLNGGLGILLGGAPGIPPAEVVIVGCGAAGCEIAKNFLITGAQVTVLDTDVNRLKPIYHSSIFGSKFVTMVSNTINLEKTVKFADVLVLAVQVPGKRTPILITEDMVRSMKPRSIIIDLSIDQGGCAETSHPTNHGSPTFTKYGVIHYCVPNMSSIVARTASYAYNISLLPFILSLVNSGLDGLDNNAMLRSALLTYKGNIIHKSLQIRIGNSIST